MEKRKDNTYKPIFYKPLLNEDIILNKSFFDDSGFDKHVHEEFAIGVVDKGCIEGFVDGKTRLINKKSIMTINPDTAHSNWSYNHNSYSQSALYLKEDFLSKYLAENFNSKEVYFKTGLLENETLAQEFISLADDYRGKRLSQLDYECRLIELLNKIFLKNSKTYEKKLLSNHEKAIYLAKEFINDNLGEDINLDDISKQTDISKYHFLRLFKEQIHISPHAYLMLKRLEKAKQLLQKGDSPIDVAYLCGFNDQSHLNRKFKSFVGVTAKEYQNFFI